MIYTYTRMSGLDLCDLVVCGGTRADGCGVRVVAAQVRGVRHHAQPNLVVRVHVQGWGVGGLRQQNGLSS